MDRIKRLRWQQRSLPDDIKINLSPQEIQVRALPSMHQVCLRQHIPVPLASSFCLQTMDGVS